MESKRLAWIDLIKLFACVLVVLGHFFQSMEAAGYLSASDLLRWFDRTIYYFHVPLFFLCSGYLHQKSQLILSVISNRELIKVERLVRQIDPECFMVVSRVTEVQGRGFSMKKQYQ